MKNIKTFEAYFKPTEITEHGHYLELEQLYNDNLKITLTPEGKEEADDVGLNYDTFSDFFDDIRANSELYYLENLGSYGLGMSDAPAITDGYYYDDDGEFTDNDHDDSQIFIYEDYYTKDFTEELYKNGYVIFNTVSPPSAEEIKKRKIDKDAIKYNL